MTGYFGLGGIGGYAAVSTGLEYERFVTQPQWISATLKLGAYQGGTINMGGELEYGEVWARNRGAFIAPGLRFHPFRNRTHADLGIGIHFPLGVDTRRDNAPGSITGGRKTAGFLGAMVGELSVNLRHGAPNHAIFGFFGNLGYCYANNPAVVYSYTGTTGTNHSEADPLIVQAGLRFGGAW